MSKISVVVPVYNVELFIERCINSILSQSFDNYDLILVDDGSQDKSGVICDQYKEIDKRIHVIHQKNAGLSAARNAGIEWSLQNSDGEWITFIDSDDWIHPLYLETLYTIAINNSVDISCTPLIRTSTYYIDESDSIKAFITKVGSPQQLAENKEISIVSACGRLYKKDLFLQIRFPQGKLFEDDYTIYKVLFSCNRIATINKELYYYFYNESSITNSIEGGAHLYPLFLAIVEQIEFFCDQGMQTIAKQRIYSYVITYKKYCGTYPCIKSDRGFRKRVKRLLRITMKKHPDVVEEAKKYGFNAWFNGISNELKALLVEAEKHRTSRVYYYFWLYSKFSILYIKCRFM